MMDFWKKKVTKMCLVKKSIFFYLEDYDKNGLLVEMTP